MAPTQVPSCMGRPATTTLIIVVHGSHINFIRHAYMCVHTKKSILNYHFYLLNTYSKFLSKKKLSRNRCTLNSAFH